MGPLHSAGIVTWLSKKTKTQELSRYDYCSLSLLETYSSKNAWPDWMRKWFNFGVDGVLSLVEDYAYLCMSLYLKSNMT